MVLLSQHKSEAERQANFRTVVKCYSLFDKFFPACGLLDYTEGIYNGDPNTPYETAQKNQIKYVLDEVQCGPGTRILEIGCGNGTLLDAVAARRAQGVGITISPEQVRLCQARGLDVQLMNYEELGDAVLGSEFYRRFDAVIANGPVEHFVQPRDAVAGLSDTIYQRFFEICHRAIDPRSSIRRMITTTIHFIRMPDPRDLLRSPLSFAWGSDNFHWAMLARSFGGWYPAPGQFERCAAGLFEPLRMVDGTYDYHLTSEEWLRRIQHVLRTPQGRRILRSTFPYSVMHPVQYATMLSCMLWTQSWNWQFRGPNPPTQLLRHTWQWQY